MKIGIIDFYGHRTVPEKLLREKILFHEGDSISYGSIKQLEDSSLNRLTTVPGIKDAVFGFTCCDDKKGQWMLFVGINEGNAAVLTYHKTPDDAISLTGAVMDGYEAYEGALGVAVRKGASREEYSEGHALSEDSALRYRQNKFIDIANGNFQLLSDVLHHARDANQRAAAAHIIAYATDKKRVIPELLYAVSDTSYIVRNNATRALGVLAAYAQRKPKENLVIPPEPFIKMINSLAWTDRNKGTMVLLALTENRDKQTLEQLKKEALPALMEMARWKNPGHAYSATMILGRMAGLKDDDINKSIFSGDKEDLLQKIAARLQSDS